MPRKSGPVPKSAEVIELHGNAGKHSREEIERRRAQEVKARPLRLRAPADLSPLELECWNLHAPELQRLGLLSMLDAGSFRFACTAYALAISSLLELRPKKTDGTPDKRKKGLAVVDVDRVHGGGLKKHPAVEVYFRAADQYRRWAIEFGLTPSSRIGLRPAAGPSAGGESDDGSDGDGFDEFDLDV